MQQKDPKTDERVEGETKRSRTAQIDQNNKTKRQEIKVKAEIRQHNAVTADRKWTDRKSLKDSSVQHAEHVSWKQTQPWHHSGGASQLL